MSQKQLNIAAKRAKEIDANIEFVPADVVDLPFKDKSFDVFLSLSLAFQGGEEVREESISGNERLPKVLFQFIGRLKIMS
ncbi:class I SAM-dependent methyltransferase [Thermococcus sp. MV5]|nr:class I SAM-dependent methyltransferase [Thermococcus sp. MV5]